MAAVVAVAAASKPTRGKPEFYKGFRGYGRDDNGNKIKHAEKIIRYLQAQDLKKDCLTEHGEKEYEQLPPDIQGLLTKEVFGSSRLEKKSLKQIMDDCKEDHKEWKQDYEDDSLACKEAMADIAQHTVESVLEELGKSYDPTQTPKYTDDLINLIAWNVGERGSVVPEESQLPHFSFDESANDSVSSAAVGTYVEGRRLRHLMFADGENRIQPKAFCFPGWGNNVEDFANSDKRSAMPTAVFLKQLGLTCTPEELEPHAERFRKVRQCLDAGAQDGANEALTQDLFLFFLVQLLLEFSPSHQVRDVTGMEVASTTVEICGSYCDKQNEKKRRKLESASSLKNRSPVVSPGTAARAESKHPGKKLQLKLRSDLVVVKNPVQKQSKLDLFLKCDVNIEMKTFGSVRTGKRKEKTQLCGESMIIASEGSRSEKTMICSLLTDCAGICVLLHKKMDIRKDDIYYLSRWETDAERILPILLWVVSFSENEKSTFKDTGFDLQEEEDLVWDDDGSPSKGDKNDRKRDHGGFPAAGGSSSLSKVKEGAEEDKEVEIVGLSSDDESSYEDEEQTPSHLFSDALSYACYGSDFPLASHVVQARDKKKDKGVRTYCLSTGQWKTASAIQQDYHTN